MTNYANGLILFRKELVTELLQHHFSVKVSVPMDENCGKIEKLGVELIPTEFERRGNNPVHDFKLFLNYLTMLKQEKPDIVLTYTIKPNLYGGLACRLKGVPYLCNVTGLGTALEQGGLLSQILTRFYRVATKKAKCVFFQNGSNMEFMHQKKIALKQSELLPGSGVNLEEHPFVPYPSEENGITFLAVIRIMKDKGIEEYLYAAEKIKQKYASTNFLLVGEYEEETRKNYEPQIRAMEEKGVLHYLGHIDHVPEVMGKSHVIVHPSYHEGLSNVLLEAAACGRPVLASNVPGCKETLIEKETGLSFASENSEALVKAIETILTFTPKERETMGKNGHAYIEEYFSRKKVIDSYFAQIHNIMK